MSIKINLISLKGSLLGRLRQKGQTLKKYLPIIITVLVLVIGLAIGKRIAFLSNQSINIPKPADLPTTITLPIDFSLTPLKQSIGQFNPQLPDPLMPEFNDSITLED
ncbi:hypothetical protein KKG65_03540 [Patescibacteria group bacterium]|nr:hypothetical protein [Patescibacteria group bacterium]